MADRRFFTYTSTYSEADLSSFRPVDLKCCELLHSFSLRSVLSRFLVRAAATIIRLRARTDRQSISPRSPTQTKPLLSEINISRTIRPSWRSKHLRVLLR